MTNTPYAPDRPDQGPDLVEVLAFLWRARVRVVIGGVAGLVLAGLFMAVCVPHHRASMIVGPPTDLAASGLAALSDGYQSATSPFLAGRGQARESPDFIRFEKTLTGPAVSTTLFQDAKIRDGLSRAQRFSFLSAPDLSTPEALSATLTRTVSVEFMGLTPLRKIVYSHPDPAFAAYLLGAIHRAADARIRVDARVRSARRIDFLESRMSRVSHPDQLRALATLLTEQEQISMMAAMDEPYAAAIVEPPSASPRPAWPRQWLVFGIFLVAGLGAGGLAAFARDNRRKPIP